MSSTYHQNSKTVTKTNPVSGHSWTEEIPMKGFTVVHKYGREKVRTEKAAINACEIWDSIWERPEHQ